MKKYVCLLLLMILSFPVKAGTTKYTVQSSKEAKELFTKVYNSTFGEQGSSLSYSVNIIGLYKTAGDIIYKGKKICYKESRYLAWEDGVTAYMVDKKKKTVGIFDYNDDAKDEYLSKFKYNISDFIISSKSDNSFYYVTAKIKDASFFGIREVVCKVMKSNLHPVSLTIKLAILHTTVQISNFKSGNIDDKVFEFPKSRFAGYTFKDNRKK